MATGYTRQSAASMVTGAAITAAIFNAEFNQLASAMDASTGHNHDGTTGGGAPIPLATGVTGQLALANGGTGANLTDPNADRILFWDDSAGAITWLTAGTNLTITGTTIAVSGLTIGTDVQAYDAGLASIAGLTTAADKMIYTTASDTYAVADLTSAGRALLDDTNASAQRTTLGLGTIATQNSNLVSITGGTIFNVSMTGSLISSLINPLAVADGGTGATTAANARTNLGLVIGTNVQAYDADILKADVTDTLTVGYATTTYDAGTKSSGTFTPDEANGNFQRIVNGGSFTLAPPTNDTVISIHVTNNGSAGTITTSGFTLITGDSLTTTNGHEFILDLKTIHDVSVLIITALQ